MYVYGRLETFQRLNDLLTISPLRSKASWSLQFPGPSLRCENVNASTHLDIRRNIASYFNQSILLEPPLGWLAWYSSNGYWNNKLTSGLPFLSDAPNGTLKFQPGRLASEYFYPQTSTMYLAAMPSMFGNENLVVKQLYHVSTSDLPRVING